MTPGSNESQDLHENSERVNRPQGTPIYVSIVLLPAPGSGLDTGEWGECDLGAIPRGAVGRAGATKRFPRLKEIGQSAENLVEASALERIVFRTRGA